jgi:flotillin
MAGTLPPMLQVMRDIGGVDIPESLAKLAGEDGGLIETGRIKVEENGAKTPHVAG